MEIARQKTTTNDKSKKQRRLIERDKRAYVQCYLCIHILKSLRFANRYDIAQKPDSKTSVLFLAIGSSVHRLRSNVEY